MTLRLWISGLLSSGLVLAAAACSSTDATTDTPGGDGGTNGKGGKSSSSSSGGDEEEDDGDGGKKKTDGGIGSGADLTPENLVMGDVQLLGIAGDDAIYAEFAASAGAIKAIPVGGGAATKIIDIASTVRAGVFGGAVAVWTGVAGAKGTLNAWTRATGLKSDIATNSVVNVFRASADGTRIAFSQDAIPAGNVAPTSTAIGVRDLASSTNAVTLTGTTVVGGTAVNLASAGCRPSMGFVGQTLVTAHCVGTATDATSAKLLTVSSGAAPTVARLDATGAAAPSAYPFWYADETASKVFFIASANNAAKVVTVAGGAITDLENNVNFGYVAKDGSAVVYRTTAGDLKKAKLGASTTITTMASGVKGLFGNSNDDKQMLFRKLDTASDDPRSDIRVVDHTVPTPAVVDIEAAANGVAMGFTGTSSHVLFIRDFSATGWKLKSIPVAGGTAKDVAANVFGAEPLSEGTGVLLISNPKKVGQAPDDFTLFELGYTDAVSGVASKIDDGVPDGDWQVKGKRLVYSRVAQTGSGLYSIALP